jgi:hypothetical protein
MKISFDFDGCLGDNKFVQMICKMFISSGHDVYILTSRDNRAMNSDLWKFADEYNIDRKKVFMTNGALKVDLFIKNEFDLHFDNSYDEVIAINNRFQETKNPLIKNESQPAILVNFDSEEASFLINHSNIYNR